GRLFEPCGITGPAGQGTGLGLATCKALIDAAGGEIECESAPGHGTCMRVRLPPATCARSSPSMDPPSQIAPRPARARPRLLLVEDEEILLKALNRTCQARFEVKPCLGAEEALAAYAAEGGAFDG